MNILKEILKIIPPSKIEVIPNDPKDKKAADQMSNLLTYLKNNHHDLNESQIEILMLYAELLQSEDELTLVFPDGKKGYIKPTRKSEQVLPSENNNK